MTRQRHLLSAAAAMLLLLWAAQPASAQSLYERLGGITPIESLVSDFIDAVGPDSVLNSNPTVAAARKFIDPVKLKRQMTSLMCKYTGGPCRYKGSDIRDTRDKLNLTEEQWDRMMSIFRNVLVKNEVGERERQDLLALVGTTKSEIVVGSRVE